MSCVLLSWLMAPLKGSVWREWFVVEVGTVCSSENQEMVFLQYVDCDVRSGGSGLRCW
jgi:hypothetical protein